jgi:predicted Zn-dependent protease
VIPKDELATYNPKDFANKKRSSEKHFKNEDELIMKAIWYEQQGDLKRSNAYYNKLYALTSNKEYLFKELTTALYAGSKSKNISKLKAYAAEKPDNLKVQRLLLSSYLNEKSYDEAKKTAKILMSKSTEAVDYELSANPYIYTGEYQEAVSLLTSAYKKTSNEDVLLKITTIEANYMKNIEGAIARLEEHRASKGCGEKVCLQLLDIYAQQRDIDKLAIIYKALYKETKDEVYAEKLIDSYLFEKSYEEAIEFLKSTYHNNELLYALYIEKRDYKKAVELSTILLSETKDPKWYAESAMALYEGTANKDDKEVLLEVVRRFDEALKQGVKNSVYLNYYGYTLIDKNIDVPRGIKIIKKALLMEPENSYYLDSLAWGYYKSNQCDDAYKIMKKVVEIEGLEEQEIVEHWRAINQKCKDK